MRIFRLKKSVFWSPEKHSLKTLLIVGIETWKMLLLTYALWVEPLQTSERKADDTIDDLQRRPPRNFGGIDGTMVGVRDEKARSRMYGGGARNA